MPTLAHTLTLTHALWLIPSTLPATFIHTEKSCGIGNLYTFSPKCMVIEGFYFLSTSVYPQAGVLQTYHENCWPFLFHKIGA